MINETVLDTNQMRQQEETLTVADASKQRLIVYGDSGLGNQMFKYAAGLYFAEILQRTLEVVRPLPHQQQWRGYSRPFQLHKFCISAKVRDSRLVDRLLFSGDSRIRRCHGKLERLLNVELFEESAAYHFHSRFDHDRSTTNTYMNGYWQAANYVQAVEPALRKQFRLRDPLNQRSREYVEKIMKLALPVSVHIRVGDYSLITHTSGTGQRVSNVLPVRYYERAFAAVTQMLPDATFVVFSDDPEKARTLLPNLDRSLFVEGNGPEAAHEDLFLMCLCKHHVIANSSFSWWGAWLNADREKLVFAPRYWGNTADSHFPDLYPAGWIIIDNS